VNAENVRKAIAIMERADKEHFDMTSFQSLTKDKIAAITVPKLHACGNTACFAGWVAISEEFQADGGHVDLYSGAPEIAVRDAKTSHLLDGEFAIAYWLDISPQLAVDLCFTGSDSFYEADDIKPHHVIDKLKALLDGEFGEQSYE
jgi:hypothetical protein